MDFKYVGNEFMKPCIEPYLMPWLEAFTVPADQKEKFFTGTGNALAFLFLKTPPEMCLEKPDDEENACAVLSDLTPGTKYSCSDTRLGYSGFQVRVGDLDFEVPILYADLRCSQPKRTTRTNPPLTGHASKRQTMA